MLCVCSPPVSVSSQIVLYESVNTCCVPSPLVHQGGLCKGGTAWTDQISLSPVRNDLGPCPLLAPGSPTPTPPPSAVWQAARQLRDTCEQELLSALQDDRVTLDCHRGCVNVWFGMWDWGGEDTGREPGMAWLGKVALRSEGVQCKLDKDLYLSRMRFSSFCGRLSCFRHKLH